MPTVLVGPTTLSGKEGPHLEMLHAAGFQTAFSNVSHQLGEEDLLRELPGKVATLAGSEPYTRRVIESAKDLRVIARAGVGYDAVDIAAATEHGVAVTITPGTNHETVAEHVFALLLALAKEVVRQDAHTKAGRWRREQTLAVRNRTLGIVGLGRIGKAVAERAAVFNMKLLAYEPFPDHAFAARHKIELCPLERVLAESDWVTLHLPLMPETRHTINKRTLALMKPTAYLINTARGGLVCEADLLDALKSGRLAGAGLDVFEVEPCRANPLFELENVVLTPHTAGVDSQSVIDMAVLAAKAIILLCRGEWPAELIVNPEVRGRFRGDEGVIESGYGGSGHGHCTYGTSTPIS
jgi:phosphoglycerate dehydrogenase-like enzyme